jgi:AAA family ATP:ADP antiporter
MTLRGAGAPVSHDERVKALLLSTWFFLTVATLWLLKSSRVTALVVHLGTRELPYVRLVGIVAVGATVFLYTLAANRLSRLDVVRVVTAAFALVLVGFWLALRAWGEPLGSSRAFIWAFYILVDVYTVVMVELFWTYTNDVVTTEEADRLYGIIGLGGILGGVAGGVVVDVGADSIGPDNFLVIGAVVLVGTMGLGTLTERILCPPPRRLVLHRSHDRKSAFAGIREVRKSQYLMLLVGLVIAYELATTLADFTVNVLFERARLSEHELARMYGRLGWMASGVAVVAQVALLPRLLPSKRRALLFTPFALLASAASVVVLPVLATALVMGSVGRGLNYSVHQSTRESLYVPLSDDQRYKAKAFIDMFVDRAAKAGASVMLLVLIALAGSSPRWTLAVSGCATVAWIVAAKRLGTYADARRG